MKQVMKIDDPRDAFILMLLERLETLEDKLNQVIEPQIKGLQQERQQLECNSRIGTTAVSKTFTMRVYYNDEGIDVIKETCEEMVRQVNDILGPENCLTVSAIIEPIAPTSEYAIIYINLRRRYWVHRTIMILSDVKTPYYTTIEKGDCAAVNAHIGLDEQSTGHVYNAFDLKGRKLINPSWTTWVRHATMLSR